MDNSNNVDFNGQNIYFGLDTLLKNWLTSIMVGESPYKTFPQDPSSELLRNYLLRNFTNGNYHSAYGASFCGFGIHKDLLNLGIKNIVVNPADIPTTDKVCKKLQVKKKSHSKSNETFLRFLISTFSFLFFVHLP